MPPPNEPFVPKAAPVVNPLSFDKRASKPMRTHAEAMAARNAKASRASAEDTGGQSNDGYSRFLEVHRASRGPFKDGRNGEDIYVGGKFKGMTPEQADVAAHGTYQKMDNKARQNYLPINDADRAARAKRAMEARESGFQATRREEKILRRDRRRDKRRAEKREEKRTDKNKAFDPDPTEEGADKPGAGTGVEYPEPTGVQTPEGKPGAPVQKTPPTSGAPKPGADLDQVARKEVELGAGAGEEVKGITPVTNTGPAAKGADGKPYHEPGVGFIDPKPPTIKPWEPPAPATGGAGAGAGGGVAPTKTLTAAQMDEKHEAMLASEAKRPKGGTVLGMPTDGFKARMNSADMLNEGSDEAGKGGGSGGLMGNAPVTKPTPASPPTAETKPEKPSPVKPTTYEERKAAGVSMMSGVPTKEYLAMTAEEKAKQDNKSLARQFPGGPEDKKIKAADAEAQKVAEEKSGKAAEAEANQTKDDEEIDGRIANAKSVVERMKKSTKVRDEYRAKDAAKANSVGPYKDPDKTEEKPPAPEQPLGSLSDHADSLLKKGTVGQVDKNVPVANPREMKVVQGFGWHGSGSGGWRDRLGKLVPKGRAYSRPKPLLKGSRLP